MNAVDEHRKKHHEVDGQYFPTEQAKQDHMKTTIVSADHPEMMEQVLLIQDIINDPALDEILRNHYIDEAGSKGLIIGEITDDLLQTIIEGVIEVCNDNIETDGRGDDLQTYVNLDNDGRQMNELKTWIREKLNDRK